MLSLSRELILPALRLEVPPSPTRDHLAALTEVSGDEWTTGTPDWIVSQVVRLAAAELLEGRFAQAGVERGLPPEADQVTLAQVAGLFRPHVDLAAQAFRVAVVEAVNAGVPAAVDSVRQGLSRVGVTGRDPLRMLALGLDKVPARAREAFWTAARGSVGLTALVDALASGAAGSDLSGLDRSQLAHADAVVQAGGRAIAVDFDRPRAPAGSWLTTPLVLSLTTPWRAAAPAHGGVVVTLGGDGWLEAFDTTLAAVAAGMAGVDLGGLPRGRVTGRAAILAERLVAARARTLADVLASLRAVHPWVAESYGPQIRTAPGRVAIAAPDDDQLVQLWLPTSALAGPLVIGAADLFLGRSAQVQAGGGGRDARQGGRSGPGQPAGGRPAGRPAGRGGDRRAAGAPATGDGAPRGGRDGGPRDGGTTQGADREGGGRKRSGRPRRGPRAPQAAPAPDGPAAPTPDSHGSEAPAHEATAPAVPAPADPAPAVPAPADPRE